MAGFGAGLAGFIAGDPFGGYQKSRERDLEIDFDKLRLQEERQKLQGQDVLSRGLMGMYGSPGLPPAQGATPNIFQRLFGGQQGAVPPGPPPGPGGAPPGGGTLGGYRGMFGNPGGVPPGAPAAPGSPPAAPAPPPGPPPGPGGGDLGGGPRLAYAGSGPPPGMGGLFGGGGQQGGGDLGGSASYPALGQQFTAQLQDPRVRQLLYASAQAEVGGQGPLAVQAYMEEVRNRAMSRGQTILQAITDRHYYPAITLSRLNQPINPRDAAMYDAIAQRVAGGSNVSHFATGNASHGVGVGQLTLNPGRGDYFGIETPDRAWATRMQQQYGGMPGPQQGPPGPPPSIGIGTGGGPAMASRDPRMMLASLDQSVVPGATRTDASPPGSIQGPPPQQQPPQQPPQQVAGGSETLPSEITGGSPVTPPGGVPASNQYSAYQQMLQRGRMQGGGGPQGRPGGVPGQGGQPQGGGMTMQSLIQGIIKGNPGIQKNPGVLAQAVIQAIPLLNAEGREQALALREQLAQQKYDFDWRRAMLGAGVKEEGYQTQRDIAAGHDETRLTVAAQNAASAMDKLRFSTAAKDAAMTKSEAFKMELADFLEGRKDARQGMSENFKKELEGMKAEDKKEITDKITAAAQKRTETVVEGKHQDVAATQAGAKERALMQGKTDAYQKFLREFPETHGGREPTSAERAEFNRSQYAGAGRESATMTRIRMMNQDKENIYNLIGEALDVIQEGDRQGIPVTGLLGRGMRYSEIVETMAGKDETLAHDFESRIEMIKEKLTPALIGRSQTSRDERAKMDAIVRGLSPGSTEIITIKDLQFLQKKMKDLQFDLTDPNVGLGRKAPAAASGKMTPEQKQDYTQRALKDGHSQADIDEFLKDK